MTEIFEQGTFRASQLRLDEARSAVLSHSIYGTDKTTVFLSHKHDDLDDLKGVLYFLQQHYNVKIYIDSRDPSMPEHTSPETANNIKCRIQQCDKFILLATNGAIESKWCNWELGYGDSKKYKDHIALFPMKPKWDSDTSYKGTEYMGLYPHIVYLKLGEYVGGAYCPSGYYVKYPKIAGEKMVPLADWFKNR